MPEVLRVIRVPETYKNLLVSLLIGLSFSTPGTLAHFSAL